MSVLYVVGTPIGNLSDMSKRAVETLEKVDFIACEDTRVTLKLLNKFNIKKTMISYHDHNRMTRGDEIISRLQSGESCALVTDAGMPAISDPGEDLVRLCRENGVQVESVPGPTAFATAMAISGMSSGRFTFEGFLSVTKQSRFEHLSELKNEKRTMIFYEAPHKLLNTLKDMLDYFGNRKIALCRELTKIHEQVINTTLEDAIKMYEESKPIGEFVLIIEGKQADTQVEYTLESAIEMAQKLVQSGMQMTKAAKEVAAETGFKKSDIYKGLIN